VQSRRRPRTEALKEHLTGTREHFAMHLVEGKKLQQTGMKK